MKTKVLKVRGNKLDAKQLAFCTETIRAGGVVIFPTDTVYGVGCNAFNPHAIERIYKLKGRSYTKPLPILLASADQLRFVAKEVHREATVLIETYWPGPLTLVFKTSPLALHAARGKDTIAVRVPKSDVASMLLAAVQVPLATTSANPSGKPAFHKGTDVHKHFFGKVDVIVDGGVCPVGEASSVVDVTHVPFTILREEAVSRKELARKLRLES